MAEKLDPKETISILELTVSHMVHCGPRGSLGTEGTAHQTGSPGRHH